MFPEACKFIRNSFYVDDFIASCKNSANYFEEMVFKSSAPQLRKPLTHFSDNNNCHKTLSLDWDSRKDLFRFPINLTTQKELQNKLYYPALVLYLILLD